MLALPPTFVETVQLSDDGYLRVTDVRGVAPGKMKKFRVGDHDILICHTKKEGFFAVENLCSHARATLEGGRLRACRLICPLHGGSFDVRDGSATGKPASAPIKTFPLRVNDDHIEVLPATD